MRILILSDIHANWEALSALQQVERKPDAVLFLGDAVGFGSDPDQCVAWLRYNVTHAIAGDCDAAVFDADELYDGSKICCATGATVEYAARQLAAPQRDYVAALPETKTVELDDTRFFMTHAGPDRLFDRHDLMSATKESLETAFKDIAADVVLVGHTHKPGIRQIADKVIVCPGSLGQPRYGVPDATYAVWDSGTIKIHHVHYDHDTTAGKLSAISLDDECRKKLKDMLERGM
jgi:putative phosphoesterase